MTAPASPNAPWDDRRLETAFAARASRIRTPTDLTEAVVARVRTEDPPMPVWGRWLPATAVIVLAVGLVAGGIALSDDVRGRGLFRAGPTADLKTLDTGEFAFDYPAAWLGYDASGAGSGFSSVAVLGTQPVERRCGTERHVDLNCVYEQRLEPGQIRVFILTGTYREQTVNDRPDIENGTTTRTRVGGMPTLLDEFDPRPDSYYGEDLLVHWEIARPGTDGASVVRLEAMLKEPGVAVGRRQLDALVASFRFTNGPDPSVTATAKPTPTDVSPRLSDLPVWTVEELIAAAESPTPEDVVVRGWLARSSAILDCSVHLEQHPLIPHCADGLLFLMDRDTPVSGMRPTVPFVVPLLRVDAHNEVEIPLGGAVEVLAVGHLRDHRWTTCPADAQAECKSRFVIDRVVTADQPLGDDLPTPWASPKDMPVSGSSEAVEVLSSVVGGVTIVSIGVADPDALRSIEWHTRAKADLQTQWVIRALVGGDAEPVARTFLVGDEGNPTVLEVTESGLVDLLAESAPRSEPPTDVLGLPVISVDEAIAIRDAGIDDREIAVRGWYTPVPPLRCGPPHPPITTPLEPYCEDAFSVLMRDPESLIAVGPDSMNVHGPEGPHISIDLDQIDRPWQPMLPVMGPSTPIEIVVMGHFDDRRSSACSADRQQPCRDRLVVDRVESVHDTVQPLSVMAHVDVLDDAIEPIKTVVADEAPESSILSIAVYKGVDVGWIEPSLRKSRPGITDQAAIWVVRVLEGERAVTYLVVDGTDRIFEMTSDGKAVDVSGQAAN